MGDCFLPILLALSASRRQYTALDAALHAESFLLSLAGQILQVRFLNVMFVYSPDDEHGRLWVFSCEVNALKYRLGR